MATKKAPDFVIDLNGWQYEDFKEYQSALQEDDFDTAAGYACRVVVSWPFANPISRESILELGFADMIATYRAIGLALKKSFSEGE